LNLYEYGRRRAEDHFLLLSPEPNCGLRFPSHCHSFYITLPPSKTCIAGPLQLPLPNVTSLYPAPWATTLPLVMAQLLPTSPSSSLSPTSFVRAKLAFEPPSSAFSPSSSSRRTSASSHRPPSLPAILTAPSSPASMSPGESLRRTCQPSRGLVSHPRLCPISRSRPNRNSVPSPHSWQRSRRTSSPRTSTPLNRLTLSSCWISTRGHRRQRRRLMISS
jgi:hypothetical protein